MYFILTAAAKLLQSCPSLCDPRDGSPPGSPVPGILQTRTLKWVAISFSNAWKWKVKVKLLSRVWLLATPWTAAHQAPPSMGFAKQEYWSGLPLPSLLYTYSTPYLDAQFFWGIDEGILCNSQLEKYIHILKCPKSIIWYINNYDFAKVDCRNVSPRLYKTKIERQLLLLCFWVKAVCLAEMHC